MPVTRRVVRHQFSVPAPPPAPWSPLSLPNLVAWYKGDAGVTAGATFTWADQSGNGNHLTQATAGNQPSTGANTIGGVNVLTFDGVTDFLENTSIAQAQPLTVLVVAQATTLGASYRSLYDVKSGASPCATYLEPGGSPDPHWNIGAGSDQVTPQGATLSAFQSVTVHNGASTQFFYNGTQVGTTFPAGANSLSGLRTGADRNGNAPWAGYRGELVVMGSSITSGDRTEWDTYCARFGL